MTSPREQSHWVPFYEAFADKLLTFRDRREELVTWIHKITSRVGKVPMPSLEDRFADGTSGPLRDICPFTVICIFNRRITNDNRRVIATDLAKRLGVTEPVPSFEGIFDGIPLLDPRRPWFFGYDKDREDDDIDALWEIFSRAITFTKSSDAGARSNFISAYDDAASRAYVNWNLTIGLYWIRPWNFPTLDQSNREYIEKKLRIQIRQNSSTEIIKAKDYLDLRDTLEACFQKSSCPVRSFPQLSFVGWYLKYSESSASPKPWW